MARAVAAKPQAAPERPQPGRVERRRARVRQRILDVVEELTETRGVDDFTIDDITEAADVARRTFYHYFDSKHDVLVPIARARARDLNRRIDRVVENIDDPAEVVSIAMRHTLRSMPEDPLVAWFIFRSGLPQQRLHEGIGESGSRDVSRGIESGRFALANAAAADSLLSGAMIGALSGRLEGTLDDSDLDDVVEYLLRLLGVPVAEAQDLAHLPLPRLGRSRS
jgi:AcrR family transcriptional regulator